MNHVPDDDIARLAEQAIAGDRQAFSTLVRRLMNPVTALTYRMTGDRDVALDLAQETFITAWEKRHQFRGEASVGSWVYRIAGNKALNYLQSRKRQEELLIERADQATPREPETPDTQAYRSELAVGVKAFMATLPPQQRMIFDMRFYKKMTFEEIAAATERAVGTVKAGYREAVRKLREHATRKGWQV